MAVVEAALTVAWVLATGAGAAAEEEEAGEGEADMLGRWVGEVECRVCVWCALWVWERV